MATTATRKIVRIDEDKCDGCGLCIPSCAEGAIRIVNGKAKLIADNLCDGLGECLGECPQEAITIEERPADGFDEEAVDAHRAVHPEAGAPQAPASCPGAMLRKLSPAPRPQSDVVGSASGPSRLGHWPVQLGLLPPGGAMWEDADVLIAADCVAFAAPDFHDRLLGGKTVAVACPKLDDIEAHTAKLTAIFAGADIRSVTVAHMEVPCCSGIVRAVRTALEASGRTDIPVHDVTVKIDGTIIEQADQTSKGEAR